MVGARSAWYSSHGVVMFFLADLAEMGVSLSRDRFCFSFSSRGGSSFFCRFPASSFDSSVDFLDGNITHYCEIDSCWQYCCESVVASN